MVAVTLHATMRMKGLALSKKEKSEDKTETIPIKYRLFAENYLSNGYNGTKAALDAGYSKTSASAEAHRLLRTDKVKKLIEQHLEDAGASKARIIQEVVDMALKLDAADFEPALMGMSLKDLRKSGVDTRNIKKMKSSRRMVGGGDGAYEVEDIQIELYDRQKALENLAKLSGANAPEVVQVPVDVTGLSVDQLKALIAAGASVED